MLETPFYQKRIKPMMKKIGVYCIRIELDTFPDLILVKGSVCLFAEMKSVNKRKTKPFDPGWRRGQLAFLKTIINYGYYDVTLILNYCGETYFLPPRKTYKPEELEWMNVKEHFLKKLKEG